MALRKNTVDVFYCRVMFIFPFPICSGVVGCVVSKFHVGIQIKNFHGRIIVMYSANSWRGVGVDIHSVTQANFTDIVHVAMRGEQADLTILIGG